MRDTLIGLQNCDTSWWDGEGWSLSLFSAAKFYPNEAVMVVKGMGERGVKAYTEHYSVAAKRYFEMTKESK